ncbi:hypothetical protein GBF38_015692 [Nibea albiflora]|uniref:Uncharacterized protein n=1 Tax=Nibea albiflora TaxID=240163 RepID=A0ACB7ELP0_NIBAL|nr:hypothetical protein GBF38_015692 [Nibea albiflora]
MVNEESEGAAGSTEEHEGEEGGGGGEQMCCSSSRREEPVEKQVKVEDEDDGEAGREEQLKKTRDWTWKEKEQQVEEEEGGELPSFLIPFCSVLALITSSSSFPFILPLTGSTHRHGDSERPNASFQTAAFSLLTVRRKRASVCRLDAFLDSFTDPYESPGHRSVMLKHLLQTYVKKAVVVVEVVVLVQSWTLKPP